MTFEYWDKHCHLVGYPARKLRRVRAPTAGSSDHRTRSGMYNGFEQTVLNEDVSGSPGQPGSLSVNSSEMAPVARASMDPGGNCLHHISADSRIVTALSTPSYSTLRQSTNCNSISQTGLPQKRRHENLSGIVPLKRQAMENGTAAGFERSPSAQLLQGDEHRQSQEIVTIMQQNKKLHAECKERERTELQLLVKVIGQESMGFMPVTSAQALDQGRRVAGI